MKEWTIPRLTYVMVRSIAPGNHWLFSQLGKYAYINFSSQCISKSDDWKRIRKIRSGNAGLRFFSSCTIAEFPRIKA